MPRRVDSASKLIRAPASKVYQAFATAEAMETWLPPRGMSGRMHAFDFCEGGACRLRLSYNVPQHLPGKTAEEVDDVEVRFVKLIQDQRIEQAATFDSEDPAFSGTMRIVWSLESVMGGTLVTVRCEDVPAGIRPEDHQSGLTSTLDNLAAFTEVAE